MTETDVFWHHLEDVEDPRVDRTKKHKPADILCSCGGNSRSTHFWRFKTVTIDGMLEAHSESDTGQRS